MCSSHFKIQIKIEVQELKVSTKWNLIFELESSEVGRPSRSGFAVHVSPERFILRAFTYASDLKLSRV